MQRDLTHARVQQENMLGASKNCRGESRNLSNGTQQVIKIHPLVQCLENCFSDIKKFIITQVNDQIIPIGS